MNFTVNDINLAGTDFSVENLVSKLRQPIDKSKYELVFSTRKVSIQVCGTELLNKCLMHKEHTISKLLKLQEPVAIDEWSDTITLYVTQLKKLKGLTIKIV